MCLIFLSWQQDPQRPLIVAANRDEFFARPTLAADFWPDQPGILAGRDREHGGSWMGISRNRRFAAVTNLRDTPAGGERSRGNLVRDFLAATQTSGDFLQALENNKRLYRPFNLVVCDGASLAYSNNIHGGWQQLEPGQHILGNIPLQHSNNKTRHAERDMQGLDIPRCSERDLLAMLRDDAITEPGGDPLQQVLSMRFVKSPDYGTRSSAILFQHRSGRQEFWEYTYDERHQRQPSRYFGLNEKGELSDRL